MGRHRLHAAPPRRGVTRRTAVRTGLLGVSVAVALGTAAVTTGFVPIGGSFPYVGPGADRSETKATPVASAERTPERQGGLAGLSGRASSAPAGKGGVTSPPAPAGTSASPSPSGSTSASPPPSPSTSAPSSAPSSAAPSPSPSTKEPKRTPTPPAPKPPAPKPVAPEPAEPEPPTPEPVAPKPAEPEPPAPKPTTAKPTAPTPDDGHNAEEAAVLTLVNQERAMAGCGPVRANPPLAALAGAFSKDMAVRGFFDHTDPDGNTPWTRADRAGISGMGGENIARGQGDADAVMKAWMNSPGHKANILNCEFRTLGVGVHVASGGPWWTQDFGF
ncbi:CAP domain-containing protein [Streptomyces sp. NPDC058623]|uniref:CAP domain-containing protein n=1 Tax=Streptomyces sp. NPDC058623 TaxID=3346563 RepID=UPI0036469CBD